MGVAMGSEKRPRPLARLAYPLPLGVEGLGEWADVTIESGLGGGAEAAAERLRAHCPDGLRIRRMEQVPHHASPVDELAETAHWAWLCPGGLLADAVERTKAFEGSESFRIAKAGKLNGAKGMKSVEARGLVLSMEWDGGDLRFATSIVRGHALNPLKLFAAIMGREGLGTFRRLRVDLREDPRLRRHDKYAHKLRNLYEDAVLLEAGQNVMVLGGDDDGLLDL